MNGSLPVSDTSLSPAVARPRMQDDQSIFEAIPDALLICTPAGRIVEGNPAALRLFGYAAIGMRSLPVEQLITVTALSASSLPDDTAGAEREFRARGILVRSDGTTLHADVRRTHVTYQGTPHILIMARDISAEVSAYQSLELRVAERTRELSTLLQVTQQVASTLSLQELLGQVLRQLKSIVDYWDVAIFMLEPDDTLSILDYAGPLAREVALANHERTILGAGYETYQAVIQRRAPVIIADIWGDERLAQVIRAARGAILQTFYADRHAWMGVPLLAKDKLIGLLTLSHRAANYYAAEHAELALAFANHAAIAIENSRLYAQAKQLAALEERQKLARELHDSVSQALYGIALGAQTARVQLDRDVSKVKEPLEYVLQLAEAGLAEMRALIFELRPESLAQEGLVAALTKHAAALRARHPFEVQTAFCAEPPISLDAKEVLYRIAQESLHNVVKHARATRVEIQLTQAAGVLALSVQDDGQGFDPQGDFPGHLGLKSMRERVAGVGGTLTITSAPEQGTRTLARIPLAA